MIIELEPSFEIELVDEMISQLEDMKRPKVMDNGHYLVGNTVQYSCHEGYVLIGEPIIRCTETGLWSHAPPFCKFIYACITDIYIFAKGHIRDNEPVPFTQGYYTVSF